MDAENTEWLTPKQAAKRLQVSKRTIANWVKLNKLEASKPTQRSVRISAESLRQLMSNWRQDR